MNPFLHSQLNGIRADEMLYRLSDRACQDPLIASQEFKDFGITWLVVATPLYEEKYFKAPTRMKRLLNQVVQLDKSWKKLAELPKQGASPATTIYKKID